MGLSGRVGASSSRRLWPLLSMYTLTPWLSTVSLASSSYPRA